MFSTVQTISPSCIDAAVQLTALRANQSGFLIGSLVVLTPVRPTKETRSMLKATAGKVLPTTITGSLPRPSWYTENLGIKSFLDAMVISRFREQYVDALSVYLREQEVAGLDIVTDGDCRFDQDVGGQSWTSYPPHHMSG